MRKFMICAAFVAAMGMFTSVNAQDVKVKRCTSTEQCQKKCDKVKTDCKAQCPEECRTQCPNECKEGKNCPTECRKACEQQQQCSKQIKPCCEKSEQALKK